ncbi:unnamed protein product [Sphagnum balticum]
MSNSFEHARNLIIFDASSVSQKRMSSSALWFKSLSSGLQQHHSLLAFAPMYESRCREFKISRKSHDVIAKMGYTNWLRVHGKLLRPDLSKEQHLELKECFELLDTSGSGKCSKPLSFCAGWILMPELVTAFHVLGMDVKQAELNAIMAEARRGPSAEYSLPFCFLAQAYRRKKLIEAVMEGNKATIERIKYQTFTADMERQALKDEAAGKSKQVRGQLNNVIDEFKTLFTIYKVN